VATANGFWAFEMEHRGASEVLAIDLPPEHMDWPGNTHPKPKAADAQEIRSFDVAHKALESRVQWREMSVYDLDPGTVGKFDFIFMGSLLLHLRDPVGALASVRRVLHGELLSVDAISRPLTALHPLQPIARFEAPGWPLWWVMNLQAYRQLFGAADLEIVASGRPFFVKSGATYVAEPNNRSQLHQRLHRAAATRLGNLHAWVRATAHDS
jgi:tRNA (mo5U34)-methyltransferase